MKFNINLSRVFVFSFYISSTVCMFKYDGNNHEDLAAHMNKHGFRAFCYQALLDPQFFEKIAHLSDTPKDCEKQEVLDYKMRNFVFKKCAHETLEDLASAHGQYLELYKEASERSDREKQYRDDAVREFHREIPSDGYLAIDYAESVYCSYIKDMNKLYLLSWYKKFIESEYKKFIEREVLDKK